MSEIIETLPSWLPIVAAVLVVVVLLAMLALVRGQFSADRRFDRSLHKISYDMLSDIVVPKADEGEIQLDLVLLTANGIVIVEQKDVDGIVFGSDRMQDWTVMSGDRRYTFANPQTALFDRVAAIKQIVRDVPVVGRIVFTDTAKFTKGVPGNVANLTELLQEFPRIDRKRPAPELSAFFPHWERLREEAVSAQVGKLFEA